MRKEGTMMAFLVENEGKRFDGRISNKTVFVNDKPGMRIFFSLEISPGKK